MSTGFFVPSPINNLIPIQAENKPRHVSIYYQNVRGLRTKTKTVHLNSSALDFDIYILTETWLTSSISNLEIFDAKYSVFRKDRFVINPTDPNNRLAPRGGGVLIAIKNKLHATEIAFSNHDSLEMVGVCLKGTSNNIFLINCYIPPNRNIDFYNEFVKSIESFSSSLNPSDEILIFGDFNIPNIKWTPHDEENFLIPVDDLNELESLFIDSLNSCFLQQISTIKNHQSKQLDLVFATDWDNIVPIESSFPLVAIDVYHPPLGFSLCVDTPVNDKKMTTSMNFNFNKTNFNGLNLFLKNIDFTLLFCNNNIEQITSAFYEILLEGFKNFVPLERDKDYNSSPPWFTGNLKTLRNRKNKVWRKYLKTKNDNDYSDFKILFNSFKLLLNQSYNHYISDMSTKLKSNPKSFWRFVNSRRKSDEYPSFMKFSNSSSGDPATICEFFRSFFSKSYTDTAFIASDSHFSHLDNCLKTSSIDLYFDEAMVKNYLNRLRSNTSPGPDGIPEIILKNCSEVLASPLSCLFNLSISLGVFPSIWKNAFIRPTHKSNARNDVSNYRPIAKLSAIPKLFELIIFDEIYPICKDILVSNQHGFMKHKSTITNLVECTSKFIANMEEGFQTDVVYTDLSKAFDILPHSIILLKLKAYGFPVYFLNWIKSYLIGRNYNVTFRGITSSPILSNSGVPQGSHLGPLLFILSVNDVISILNHSEVQIYADDMKFFKKIVTESDSTLLQHDLDNFYNWCTVNNLKLNIGKCQFVTYSRRVNRIETSYSLNGEPLQRVELIKDLGIYFDEKLSFKNHYSYIINKANSMLGFVKRWSKDFPDPYTLKTLFTALVRPNLEYASQVWSPFYRVHINRIESIQRNFLRYALRNLPWADPLVLPSYINRLKLINLSSLEKRREMADLIFLIEIINNNVLSKYISDKIHIIGDSSLRSPNLFTTFPHRTNYGMFEPVNRMLKLGNKYKQVIDFSLSKQLQKKKLLNHPIN